MSESTPPTSAPVAPARSWGRRCCLLGVALLGLGLLAALVGVALEAESPPAGEAGAAAEGLADRIEAAVNLPAWRRTQALRWTFVGVNRHLWDRRRGLARVEKGQRKVLLVLSGAGATGRAWEGERELGGEELSAARAWAWSAWCNDSFWLNPLAKMRDPGTERLACGTSPEGLEQLLVSYASGGVTPGDRYLWQVDGEGLPANWKMWVSILPVGGVDATWEGWLTLGTGAKVAREHRLLGGLRLELSEIAGAETLAELEPGPDPFGALFE